MYIAGEVVICFRNNVLLGNIKLLMWGGIMIYYVFWRYVVNVHNLRRSHMHHLQWKMPEISVDVFNSHTYIHIQLLHTCISAFVQQFLCSNSCNAQDVVFNATILLASIHKFVQRLNTLPKVRKPCDRKQSYWNDLEFDRQCCYRGACLVTGRSGNYKRGHDIWRYLMVRRHSI